MATMLVRAEGMLSSYWEISCPPKRDPTNRHLILRNARNHPNRSYSPLLPRLHSSCRLYRFCTPEITAATLRCLPLLWLVNALPLLHGSIPLLVLISHFHGLLDGLAPLIHKSPTIFGSCVSPTQSHRFGEAEMVL
jgi:hypothetical protein